MKRIYGNHIYKNQKLAFPNNEHDEPNRERYFWEIFSQNLTMLLQIDLPYPTLIDQLIAVS